MRPGGTFGFMVVLALSLITGVELTLDVVDEVLREDFFAIYSGAAVKTRYIQNRPVTKDKVTFYLYTADNPDEFVALNPDNLKRLRNTTSQIVFIMHGWTGSFQTDWMQNLKNAFLVRDNSSLVVLVDWRHPANQFYYVSSINTYDVSKFITKLLVNLYKNYGVNKEQFLLVGHSLGGQVCGFVGKLFKEHTLEKLPRIIALDPAGPLFWTRPLDKRLNKNDADVVEVIHTDGGTFGFLKSCGTIDFFVNGGSTQPGCMQINLADLDLIGAFVEPLTCDHRRSTEYFIEAILNPHHFVAQKCSSWATYKVSYCDDSETVAMGNLTTTLKGDFYLDTNGEKPYSKKISHGISLSRLIQF